MFLFARCRAALAVIALAGAAIFSFAADLSSGDVVSLRIVDQGSTRCVVIIPKDADPENLATAQMLVKYVKLATGAKITIYNEGTGLPDSSKARIYIGPTERSSAANLPPSDLDQHGFVIAFPDRQSIVIIGTSNAGTEYGVDEFLERYLGVRWLMPGEVGEFIPEKETVDVPARKVREEPAFLSREMSGFPNPTQWLWARRMRMKSRIAFQHNMVNLFPPELFRDTNPEIYPLIDGKRYLPKNSKDVYWQPCFSNPELVGIAVKRISEWFQAHPGAVSYSLGINDGDRDCECESCRRQIGGRVNSVGRPDMSNLYFNWANAVVKEVKKEYPDKLFGCLAYAGIADPPDGPVDPSIVPFLTSDRLRWLNPEAAGHGKELTRGWSGKAGSIGWYDIYYGSPYLVPRIYFHFMAETIRYARDNGVVGMYTEAWPNWGEGPKLYLAAKLFWNPDLDVDNVLHEWYVDAVGKDAADDLAAYYALWEDFWAERAPQTRWFRKTGVHYLNFRVPDYLDLVTFDDIEHSRKLLEAVMQKVRTPQEKVRATVIMKEFEYYEASALSYLALVKGLRNPGRSMAYYRSLAKKRYQLMREFAEDEILVHPRRFDNGSYPRLEW